jgi:uncharacterized protein
VIRVVLDTNIIVSALLQPLGLPAQVFMLAVAGRIEFYVSGPIYAEYEEVIQRRRLKLEPQDIEEALRVARERAVWVAPLISLTVANDPDDNIFLECAEADFLVTGNVKDYPMTWRTTRIVTARTFLEMATPVL